MAGSAPLTFYFDFLSPYAYLGWTQIHALAARHGRDVLPVPVLFAAFLNAHETKGPAEIPPKREYIFKHTLRLAHDFGVPFAPPPAHPFNPLVALRVASLPRGEPARRRIIDALFGATWGGGGGVAAPADVVRALDEAGFDGEGLVAQAGSAEAKERVRAQTERALEGGAFGVPTVGVDGELFWGVDSLPHVERFLEGKDPVDPRALAVWARLPQAASRTPRPPL